MTFPDTERVAGWKVTTWIEMRMIEIVALCVALICVGLVAMVWLQWQISGQANAGRQARQRQCETAPVSEKEQAWFHERHVITDADLLMYQRGAPSLADCAAVSNR